MATIEETIISPLQQRAIDYCDKKRMPKLGRQIAVIAYMHGATDQRQIDVDKACEHLRKLGYFSTMSFHDEEGVSQEVYEEMFRNAMMEEYYGIRSDN